MWWIIGGIVYLLLGLLVFSMCKVSDRADRDMGLK